MPPRHAPARLALLALALPLVLPVAGALMDPADYVLPEAEGVYVGWSFERDGVKIVVPNATVPFYPRQEIGPGFFVVNDGSVPYYNVTLVMLPVGTEASVVFLETHVDNAPSRTHAHWPVLHANEVVNVIGVLRTPSSEGPFRLVAVAFLEDAQGNQYHVATPILGEVVKEPRDIAGAHGAWPFLAVLVAAVAMTATARARR